MKIALISPYPDVTAYGLRTISAYLKLNGFQTRVIFVPDPFGDGLVAGLERYSADVRDQVAGLCKDVDLVGITLMTNFFEGAVQLTRTLKQTSSVPVIWGGVHPTIRPLESLGHADIVCIGDGEENMLELASRIRDGKDYMDVAGLWLRAKDGSIIRNSVAPLEKDLDKYPMPDYSLEDHHVLIDGRMVPMTEELLKRLLERGTVSEYLHKIGYQTMTGRGCPHKCTYCINDVIKNIYGGQGYLRWRSNEHVMKEFLWVKEHMPWVGYMWISDDAFFARKTSDIEDFCREYKKLINLPFSCLASPLTVTEEKMAILVDAGMIYMQMGIQTGSARIQDLYNRKNMNNERVLRAVRIINKYKDRMFAPSYDFILDVPYENDEDRIASLRLIAEMPKPYKLQPFSLVLYPETELYKRAKSDGFISNELKDIYGKSFSMNQPTYLNLLMMLAKHGKFPGPLLKLLVSHPLVDVLNSRPLKPLFRVLIPAMRFAYRFLKHHLK